MIDLDVFLHERRVGRLHSDDSARFVFQYDADFADSGCGMLSCSLPLRAEEYSYREARPFFMGLLPEEESRDAVVGRLRLMRSNDLLLADAVGGECAGAVSLLRPGRLPQTSSGEIDWLDDQRLSLMLGHLSARSLLAAGDHVRLSLAGAMCKLTVCFDGGRFGIPSGGTPSTHIVKPGMTGLEGLVHNECFCARLAEKAGLEAAKTSVLEHPSGTFLLAERYDRCAGKRIHQEDFCQALGYIPADKYQASGGPGIDECCLLLRKYSAAPEEDVFKFIRAVVFNMLIGNGDAHAKNFSLLHPGGGSVRLAPLYDLVSTEVYDRFRGGGMAMKFGGTYDFNWVNRRHAEALADSIGAGRDDLCSLMLDMCGRLPDLADACFDELKFPIGRTIAGLVRRRAALIQARLSL